MIGWISMHWFRRLYNRLLDWSASKYGLVALALVSFAESVFFPVPPDVLIISSTLARPRVWLVAASVCSVASVLGGLAGYAVGMLLWTALEQVFYNWVPGFTPEVYARVSGLYQTYDFWVVFAAGFTPIPYKVFTIAAGAASLSLSHFVVASALSRSARFFLVAGAVRAFGPRIKPVLERYLGWITVALFALIVLGFVVVTRMAH